MNKLAVIILAAGKGTRMNSQTAKVLHEIHGKPMICYVVDTAVQVAGNEIIIVVGVQAEKVKSVISDHYDVRFALQKEQLGTGHAVMCALPEIPGYIENVVILCGDVPLITAATLSKLIKSHASCNNAITVLGATMENPFGYGRLVCDDHGNVTRIVEEADASAEEKRINLINTGIYCTKRELLEKFLGKIDRNNSQQEMYLTDIIGLAESNHYKVGMVACSDINETLGVNNRDDLKKVTDFISPN